MSEIYYEVMRDYTTTVHYNVGVNNSIYHFHQQLELLYVEQGEVEVTINDKKQTITKGQLVIADSFYNHQFIHNENALFPIFVTREGILISSAVARYLYSNCKRNG